MKGEGGHKEEFWQYGPYATRPAARGPLTSPSWPPSW